MRFVLNELADLDGISKLPGYEEATPDLVDAVLEEAGKLASDVLAPLNQTGDQEGCVLENGVVRTPKGFPEAYAQFIEGGWNGLPFDPDYGGQGLPMLVSAAAFEIWQAANMAFAICPTLTQAAVELLTIHGSDGLKAVFMEKLVSGVWTGTMNLTEPQAGSDLSKVRTKAVKDEAGPEGQYRVTGQKIFITHGEQDFTDNIIHMVLARTPDAPEGIKGISLFVVPKFLVKDDGVLGGRNDLKCVSLEHKLGLHASPTCVMAFGDDADNTGGALGYLLGEENRGIEYMFTMMNNARLAIGVEGVGVAERAYQNARAYATERTQGGGEQPVSIDHHPDVRRMLLSMRAQVEAIRALTYYAAAALDAAKRHPDEATRREKQALVDLLIPVVKAWSTDTGIDVANTGIQVFGGAGYIEESGAPQFLRDIRVSAIYEGTNGIQALDLVGRKVARDQGASAEALISDIKVLDKDLAEGSSEDLEVIRSGLSDGIAALTEATGWIVDTYPDNPDAVAAGAVPYLRLFGIVAGGWLMARAALAAEKHLKQGAEDDFSTKKMISARFYADHILNQAPALAMTVTSGWNAVNRFKSQGD